MNFIYCVLRHQFQRVIRGTHSEKLILQERRTDGFIFCKINRSKKGELRGYIIIRLIS